jgi:hypothetical protein
MGSGTDGGFLDMSAFKVARKLWTDKSAEASIPRSSVIFPSAVSLRQKADLMLEAVRHTPANLVIGYFPIVDEFNHSWFDLFVTEGPDGYASRLFTACVELIDVLLGKLMTEAGSDTLLVLSSDHGAMAHRRVLHLNELFADAGFVKRIQGGYDLRRSSLYYHPSDCGQVVANPAVPSPAAGRGSRLTSNTPLPAIREVIGRANTVFTAQIAIEPNRPDGSYAAFLFPLGDTYFTGRAPRKEKASPKNRSPLDSRKAGSHHLSPLSPTPWIQALLGLWTPDPRGRLPGSVPSANRDVKDFLLDLLDSSPRKS